MHSEITNPSTKSSPTNEPFDSVTDFCIVETASENPRLKDSFNSKTSLPKLTIPKFSQEKWVLIAAGFFTFLVLAALAIGVLRIKTPNGTIVIENLPEDAEVLVDGERVAVTWNEGKDRIEAGTAPGEHVLSVVSKGVRVFGEKVEVDAGGKHTIKLSIDSTSGTSRLEELLEKELVVNPGCENALTDGNISGWTVESGKWTPRLKGPYPVSGIAYFYPGVCSIAELSQEISIEDLAEFVDANLLDCKLSAFLATLDQTPSDTAELVVVFLDRNRAPLGQFASGRVAKNDWTEVKTRRALPAGCRFLSVKLVSRRAGRRENNAYFDDVSIMLSKRSTDRAKSAGSSIIQDNTSKTSLPDSATNSIKTGNWIDLLALVEPAKHAIVGKWERQGDSLVGLSHTKRRFMVPYIVDGSYSISMEFTRLTGTDFVSLRLPVGDTAVDLMVSGWSGQFSGLYLVDGTKLDRRSNISGGVAKDVQIVNGNRYRFDVDVSVKDGSATVLSKLDGRPLVSWSGDYSRLSSGYMYTMPSFRTPGVIVHNSQTQIHKFDLMLVGNGKGKQLGDDWGYPFREVADAPPSEVAGKCVKRGNKYYFISDTPIYRLAAQQLAERLKGSVAYNFFDRGAFCYISNW